MSVSSEHEIAHARDVTITECQERLREMAGHMLDQARGELGLVPEIPTKMALHFRDAALALDTLRMPTEITSATRARLKEAGELCYRILTTAGDRRHADAWASLASDLWNVLRIYELPGREGG
jgi:hypothetical protein